MFRAFLDSDKIYNIDTAYDILTQIRSQAQIINTSKVINKRHCRLYNIPCSFDIEVSSFYQDNDKKAVMYVWTFGIDGAVIMGRTWNEFCDLCNMVSDVFKLTSTLRLICYCHNLMYEFQFMRKWFDFDKVFAIKERKPVYAITTIGIEFRCSYILSGYNLDTIGKNLTKYKVLKLVGNLDYDLIRTPITPLYEKEIAYCVNDVKIVLAYIQERIEIDGDISKIPLTKTGYVRQYCREKCIPKNASGYGYRNLIKKLTVTVQEYDRLKRAFQGGFTHANAAYIYEIVNNVSSFDFTSSYPAVMVAEQFPMGKAELVEVKDEDTFVYNLKNYCCLFDIEFTGLSASVIYENYLSLSRCRNVKAMNIDGVQYNVVVNNGRIVKAGSLVTTITEQDYMILCKLYKWKSKRIGNFRRYQKAYLPTSFIEAVIKLYVDKTKLKGIKGKEREYLSAKELLNALYGMCVTDICREEFPYNDGEWLSKEQKPNIDYEKTINAYNNNNTRFSFYAWGVWVTAYARRNLFSAIIEFGADYVYSDTDSVKVINAEKHMDYIKKYNAMITSQIERALEYHGIDKNLARPKTIKGVEKPLGVWDFEETYLRFKTLGAKRYMTETEHGLSITVSGLNKSVCVPYICDGWYYDLEKHEYGSPFDKFGEEMYVPSGCTGKMTHTYVDTAIEGIVYDYMGKSYQYYEKSYIHLENSDYTLSMSEDFIDYILGIKMDSF